MSGNRRFVDTNILVYAHDESAGGKCDQARAVVAQLWDSRDGCLSVQVLQEFFVTVTRKIAKPLALDTAKEIVADLSSWYVHAPAADDVLAAVSIHQSTGISFWDAMIVRSAAEIGCTLLYSEDLNPGREYAGVRVENPLRPLGTDHGKKSPRQCQAGALLRTICSQPTIESEGSGLWTGTAARPAWPGRCRLAATAASMARPWQPVRSAELPCSKRVATARPEPAS